MPNYRQLLCLVAGVTLMGCYSLKILTPVGGSRADGTVELAYQQAPFELPDPDFRQGSYTAAKRCAAWGYSGAELFGGEMRTCQAWNMYGCTHWLVKYTYQCTTTSDSATKGAGSGQGALQDDGLGGGERVLSDVRLTESDSSKLVLAFKIQLPRGATEPEVYMRSSGTRTFSRAQLSTGVPGSPLSGVVSLPSWPQDGAIQYYVDCFIGGILHSLGSKRSPVPFVVSTLSAARKPAQAFRESPSNRQKEDVLDDDDDDEDVFDDYDDDDDDDDDDE